jgi:hypothetical protein
MKKIEVLLWGITHIAENHGFNAGTDYEEDGEVCIWGGSNLPTLADVQFLCEDLGIPTKNIENSEFGIDVFLNWEWLQENNEERDPSEGHWGMLLEEYTPSLEMWKREGATIGS